MLSLCSVFFNVYVIPVVTFENKTAALYSSALRSVFFSVLEKKPKSWSCCTCNNHKKYRDHTEKQNDFETFVHLFSDQRINDCLVLEKQKKRKTSLGGVVDATSKSEKGSG